MSSRLLSRLSSVSGWISPGWLKFFGGLVLLAGMSTHARADTFGICLFANAFGSAETSATYASVIATAGCNPSPPFTSSVGAGGTVNPLTLGPGLTTGTIGVTQALPFGGTGSATSTASLEQGVLRVNSDTQGTAPSGSCGGTCTTTGGRSIAEALLLDNMHFGITNSDPTAVGTFHAHLDGIVGLQATTEASDSILSQFVLGGVGSGCWQALGGAAGNGFGPCGSQNFGFLTSSFTNQTATGYDFTGTFTITQGMTTSFLAGLTADCAGGASCDFSNTNSFSLSLPSNVTFGSDSQVLFTQSPVPEPGLAGITAVALAALGLLRRRFSRSNAALVKS